MKQHTTPLIKSYIGLLLSILYTLSACNFLALSSVQDMKDRLIDDTLREEEAPKLSKKKAIVLLHAMWPERNCFQKTVQKLRKELPENIEIFSPEEGETSSRSITQQAERLSSMLLAKGMGKDSYDIILIGHSRVA